MNFFNVFVNKALDYKFETEKLASPEANNKDDKEQSSPRLAIQDEASFCLNVQPAANQDLESKQAL